MVEDLSFLLAHEDNKKIALTPEDFHQISVYPLKNRVPMVSEEYESTPEEFHENLSSTLKEFNTFLMTSLRHMMCVSLMFFCSWFSQQTD